MTSSNRQTPTVQRGTIVSVMLATLAVVATVLVALGSPPPGSAAAADQPSRLIVETSSAATPSVVQSFDYDDEVGGPHQDTDVEQTGRAVTPARVAVMVGILVVALGIITTLAVRARVRRHRGEGGEI